MEFAEDGAGHDEGIEVGLAHAAGEFVEGGDEFGPGVEEGVNAGVVRVEEVFECDNSGTPCTPIASIPEIPSPRPWFPPSSIGLRI